MADLDKIDQLIERSSLGTPEARALRRRTSRSDARRIVEEAARRDQAEQTWTTSQSDSHERSDADLLQRYVAGDPHAFEQLLSRHYDSLLAVAMRALGDREEATDALHDALMRVARRAPTFRSDGPVTRWLHRIVLNACVDRIRRRRQVAALESARQGRRAQRTMRDPAEIVAEVDEALLLLAELAEQRRDATIADPAMGTGSFARLAEMLADPAPELRLTGAKFSQTRIDEVELRPATTATIGEDARKAAARARTAGHTAVLVLDDRRRPVRWEDVEDLEHAGGAVATGDGQVEMIGHHATLNQALNVMLEMAESDPVDRPVIVTDIGNVYIGLVTGQVVLHSLQRVRAAREQRSDPNTVTVSTTAMAEAETRTQASAYGKQALGRLSDVERTTSRTYDTYLGGKENFTDDPRSPWTDIEALARASRAWRARVVRWLVQVVGIDQFVDIGSRALTAAENTHEVARRISPDAVVAYVENDPVDLAFARALLVDDDQTLVIDGDLTHPDDILANPALNQLLDFDRPIALLQCLTLHHLPDTDAVRQIMTRYIDALPTGSYVGLTHLEQPSGAEMADVRIGTTLDRLKIGRRSLALRTRDEIRSLLPGLELVEPGLVPVNDWWPTGPRLWKDGYIDHLLIGALARKS